MQSKQARSGRLLKGVNPFAIRPNKLWLAGELFTIASGTCLKQADTVPVVERKAPRGVPAVVYGKKQQYLAFQSSALSMKSLNVQSQFLTEEKDRQGTTKRAQRKATNLLFKFSISFKLGGGVVVKVLEFVAFKCLACHNLLWLQKTEKPSRLILDNKRGLIF